MNAAVVQISLSTIPNSLETRTGLPRPNWPAIYDWVDANVTRDADVDEIWTQLARDWIDALIESLPTGYARSESREFMVLSSGDSPTAEHLLECCESSRRIILDSLGSVAREEGYGKYVLFAFAKADTYYDYIADYYPDEGEFGLSGGMFLDDGYGHIAIPAVYAGGYERTLAHEMTHALLRHLPLPAWLNEGVTQVIEDIAMGGSYFMVDRETVRKHRDYWNVDTIDAFWSGESFYASDEGQELSYHLAQILYRNLVSDYPKQIARFLNSANYSDAGEAALVDVCGVSLCDRVTQFLGQGAWSPRSDYFEIDAE
ncbi:hypothetical protein Mal52_08920 [Symmachiella dynata]|uniref:DUF1570 domain-containing protein n=1 Tax=Symmachiella dynata TaxID=2527995 RepID=A0A517ZIX1_9PLAN|nr:hypothetical protein [Symmachiella dynata]QDU42431.1 hypothetical protein Mal52_08920 [Symmachiella dynata]